MNITQQGDCIVFNNLISDQDQNHIPLSCAPGKPFVATNAPGTPRQVSSLEEISQIARKSARTLKDFISV